MTHKHPDPCRFCGSHNIYVEQIEHDSWAPACEDCGTYPSKEEALAARASPWRKVEADPVGLCNLPKHEQEVLFKYGDNTYAGIFVNDFKCGEEGDFGFYSNEDKYFEAERVSLWMPHPPLPISKEGEPRP